MNSETLNRVVKAIEHTRSYYPPNYLAKRNDAEVEGIITAVSNASGCSIYPFFENHTMDFLKSHPFLTALYLFCNDFGYTAKEVSSIFGLGKDKIFWSFLKVFEIFGKRDSNSNEISCLILKAREECSIDFDYSAESEATYIIEDGVCEYFDIPSIFLRQRSNKKEIILTGNVVRFLRVQDHRHKMDDVAEYYGVEITSMRKRIQSMRKQLWAVA